MSLITIVDYKPEYQPCFDSFNRLWISAMFEMEQIDEEVLAHPEEMIIKPGGAILMALYDGHVAGTAGLRKIDSVTFEFTKMAVAEEFRRKGIAEALCYACFKRAKEMGAASIILYTNSLQAAAVRLYEKVGFSYLALTPGVYKRTNIKMICHL